MLWAKRVIKFWLETWFVTLTISNQAKFYIRYWLWRIVLTLFYQNSIPSSKRPGLYVDDRLSVIRCYLWHAKLRDCHRRVLCRYVYTNIGLCATEAYISCALMKAMLAASDDVGLMQYVFCFILLTYDGPHRVGSLLRIPTKLESVWRFGAKGFLGHKFCATPAYTAQLLILHQNRADNQHLTANQI